MLFFFFWVMDLYFWIPTKIGKNFNPTGVLAIPTGTPTNEANIEIETTSKSLKILNPTF